MDPGIEFVDQLIEGKTRLFNPVKDLSDGETWDGEVYSFAIPVLRSGSSTNSAVQDRGPETATDANGNPEVPANGFEQIYTKRLEVFNLLLVWNV